VIIFKQSGRKKEERVLCSLEFLLPSGLSNLRLLVASCHKILLFKTDGYFYLLGFLILNTKYQKYRRRCAEVF
jgi:hypothetical protein